MKKLLLLGMAVVLTWVGCSKKSNPLRPSRAELMQICTEITRIALIRDAKIAEEADESLRRQRTVSPI